MSETNRRAINKSYEFWYGMNYIYEQWAKKHNIIANTAIILKLIDDHHNCCTQQLICEKLMLPKQTANAVLNNLEKKGYIQRTPNAKDKRSKVIVFTKEGKVFAGEILTDLFKFEEFAYSNIPLKQCEEMIKHNENLLSNLSNALLLYDNRKE